MRQKGLEPSTSPLSGVCSSQLSYWRNGGTSIANASVAAEEGRDSPLGG